MHCSSCPQRGISSRDCGRRSQSQSFLSAKTGPLELNKFCGVKTFNQTLLRLSVSLTGKLVLFSFNITNTHTHRLYYADWQIICVV